MWFKKQSARRMAIREDVAEAESLSRPDPQRHGQVFLVAGVFFLLATAILYYPSDTLSYKVGDHAPADLRSLVPFTQKDRVKTDYERDRARAEAYPVLVANAPATDRIQIQLLDLLQDARAVPALEFLPAQVRDRFPGLTVHALAELKGVDPALFKKQINLLLTQQLPQVPTVDPASAQRLEVLLTPLDRQHQMVNTLSDASLDDSRRAVPLAAVRTLGQTTPAFRDLLRSRVAEVFSMALVDPIANYLQAFDQPTHHYDANLSAQLVERSVAQVPTQGTSFAKDQLIVEQGRVITPETLALLHDAQQAYEQYRLDLNPWIYWLAHLGRALVVLVLTVAGTLYVTRMSSVVTNVNRGWALAGLLLLTLFIAKGSISAGLENATYMLGIAPVLLTTIILIIAFNQRFALGVGSLHALLVTIALNQDVDFFLAALTGNTLFVFGLKEIRTRGRLIEIGVFAGAALMGCVWAIGLARMMQPVWMISLAPVTDLHTIAINSLWAAGGGVAVGFITLGILPFIERVFKITTAMTLLELCDANRPLLRRLATEAPGTFNHSLTVGTLAESAADAIGANGLLCRVGAYYHDVGKLSKPQYFIENQAGGPNKHDKLSPAMSLLIIVGHVKDGIELAREYHLPWVAHQFIAQHHGTTLVEYFFNAARERQIREMQQKGETPPVTEAEFRYPGPRPQSRETAILMICDGVESITRSLPDHTAGRIETVVHQLVTKRLMDGQFADCDLTLKDLSTIEGSLVRTLAGIYHGRTAYPKPLKISQTA